jgi:hypothetical protein
LLISATQRATTSPIQGIQGWSQGKNFMLRRRLAGTNRLLLCLLTVLVTTVGTGEAAIADEIQNRAKTPGVVRVGLTKIKICSIKWGRDERHVSDAMKQQVFEAHGYSGTDDPQCIPDSHGRHCEIDHLISRELGGADEVKNLWPQSYGAAPWNAARKDTLDNRLHKEVCAVRLSLPAARQMLVTDWRDAYQRYYGKP